MITACRMAHTMAANLPVVNARACLNAASPGPQFKVAV